MTTSSTQTRRTVFVLGWGLLLGGLLLGGLLLLGHLLLLLLLLLGRGLLLLSRGPLALRWQLDAVFVGVMHQESTTGLSACDGSADQVALVVKVLVVSKDVVLQGDLGATFAAVEPNDRFRDHCLVGLFGGGFGGGFARHDDCRDNAREFVKFGNKGQNVIDEIDKQCPWTWRSNMAHQHH